MDLSIKHSDFPVRYVRLPEGPVVGSLHRAAHSGEPLERLPADPSGLLVAGGSHSSNGAALRTGRTGSGRSAGSNLVKGWW